MDRNFRQALTDRQRAVNSVLCTGLDPVVEKMPDIMRRSGPALWISVFLWFKEIVDATAHVTSVFKPNHAFWEAIPDGLKALQLLVAYIRRVYPHIMIFLDTKRGDIDETQARYREAHFTLELVDGMNFCGYMGIGTMRALVDPLFPGRAIVGLGRTSNSEAWEIQDQLLAEGGTVWESQVRKTRAWAKELEITANAGIVMGAAHIDPSDPKKERIYSDHLAIAREIVGNDLWFLIPGIGKQGGAILETIRASFRGPGTIAVNSSSAISFASTGDDFAEAAARVAEKTRNDMIEAGAFIPKDGEEK